MTIIINEKLSEDFRKENKLSDNSLFLKIKKEKDKLIFSVKIPKEIEKIISKRNKESTTEQLFNPENRESEVYNNDTNRYESRTDRDISHAEYYRGVILNSDIDDINSNLFLNNGSPTINLAIMRIKDASKGVVLETTGKIPLLSEEMFKEMIKNFKINFKSFSKVIKTEIDATTEIKLKDETGTLTEQQIQAIRNNYNSPFNEGSNEDD